MACLECLKKEIPHKLMKNNLAKLHIFFLFCFFSFFSIIAQDSRLVRDALSSSPKGAEFTTLYNHLLSKLKNATTAQEKKEANAFLAEYASRCHLFKEAGAHYIEAFFASYSLGEKNAKAYLIKALKAFIMAGDIEAGYATYGKILSIKNGGANSLEYEREAELYLQYLRLAESLNDPKIESSSILKNLKEYAQDSKFREFRYSILLTLWFLADDIDAKNAILKEVPDGMEAMLINGQATIFPSTFWYLSPSIIPQREEDLAFSTSSNIPKAYQIGFFREKNYATRQKEKVERLGFIVEINEEKRGESGLYYTVLVLEKERGKTGIRLKDAGFESFPVFE